MINCYQPNYTKTIYGPFKLNDLIKFTAMIFLASLLIILVANVEIIMSKKPDVVFFLTDDQDVELFGMTAMTKTKEFIAQQGVTFSNAFVTSPICCVSRSSILTGLYAHNHGTTNNSISGGCSSKSWQKMFEWKSFANILRTSGYVTFYAGKYLNKYGSKNAGTYKHVPQGWDWWNGLIGNSVYYDYKLSINGTAEAHGSDPSDYLTTVILRKSMEFLDFMSRSSPEIPILLMLAPPAPHAPFTPEQQFKDYYDNIKAPRFPNFGAFGNDKHWLIKKLPRPIPNNTINIIDQAYRNRWRTLMSVDNLVRQVIQKMKSIGRGENTYYIYSSDNGYHAGQFGLPLDKRQLYEFDIKVPLLISGPNITKNITRHEMVLNIDIASTILELAQIHENVPSMDGRSLKPLLINYKNKTDKTPWRSHALIEYWGEGGGSKECPNKDINLHSCDVHCNCYCYDSINNTYSCLRTLNKSYNMIYCRFKDNIYSEEFYNIRRDKYQLKNNPGMLSRARKPKIKSRIFYLLKKLQKCKGMDCWR